jgi:hypothetical protein
MASHIADSIADLRLQRPRTLEVARLEQGWRGPRQESCSVMVEIGFANRSSRGPFDVAGEAPPFRCALFECGPEIVTIDEHAPMIDNAGHEHRRGLSRRQPHKLHFATNTAGKPLCHLSQTAHTRIVQHNQNTAVRMLIVAADPRRAEQHRKPDIRLGAKGRAQSPQQTPNGCAGTPPRERDPKPTRAQTLPSHQPLGRDATQRGLGNPQFGCGSAPESPPQDISRYGRSLKLVWPLTITGMAYAESRSES